MNTGVARWLRAYPASQVWLEERTYLCYVLSHHTSCHVKEMLDRRCKAQADESVSGQMQKNVYLKNGASSNYGH
jgi:hypothetical protein